MLSYPSVDDLHDKDRVTDTCPDAVSLSVRFGTEDGIARRELLHSSDKSSSSSPIFIAHERVTGPCPEAALVSVRFGTDDGIARKEFLLLHSFDKTSSSSPVFFAHNEDD